jgi:hypothetical protein
MLVDSGYFAAARFCGAKAMDRKASATKRKILEQQIQKHSHQLRYTGHIFPWTT